MRVLIALLVLTATVSAWNIPNRLDRFHKVTGLPLENTQSPMRFRISLARPRLAELETIFWDITNPDSPNYRQWLSSEEVTEIVALPDEDITSVINWLKTEQPSVDCELTTELSKNKDYIFVNTCAARVQAMFKNLDLVEYYNPVAEKTVIRHRSLVQPDENKDFLEVPTELHSLINAIFDLTEMPVVPFRKRVGGSGFPGDNITPAILRSQYQVPSDVDGSQATAGVGEFDVAAYYSSDLSLFQSKYDLPSNTPQIIGSNDPSSSSSDETVEASLDIQYVLSTANSASSGYFHNNYNDYLDWALDIANYKIYVHSVSWGSLEDSYTKSNIDAASTEFMKLGTQGYSLMYSSGDDGPGNSGFFGCGDFTPQFPASSPYITAVGATYLQDSEEIAVSFSGGGFSTFFSTPSYQASAVSNYLSNASDLPDSSKYNSKGRGYPDVAAFGTNYQVYVDGSIEPVAGTSCSSPAFASIVAGVNSQRAASGKGRVGFLNQAIYKAGSIGTDITSGANVSSGCSKGFSTATGWDPVSGLGSPIFDTLMSALDD